MKRRQWLTVCAVWAGPLILGLALSPLLASQDAGLVTGAEVAQGPAPLVKPPPSEAKDVKRFPDIEEATKDMGTMEGLFTLYRFDPGDKKRDPEKLLAKIPRHLIGEDLLFAMSTSRGQMAGFMGRDFLVKWEITGNQLKLSIPDVRYVRTQGAPVDDVVERTYNDAFLAAVPIVAMSPQGDVVIDLGALLKSEIADVGRRVRPELSTWAKVKNFPDNVLIDVDLALSAGQGGEVVGVSYAFRRLPKLGAYKPRVADPRVGYFITVRADWTKKAHERELFERYINRWHLEKRDPSLELSPPKQPITFIIEKTVPIQWRKYVREGILDWNKAFEKIGFTDAIVAQQQTEDNEYADYDPEDARYNFFRWIVTGNAFAMGPSRADPRTGQILDADIIFDDSFVRAWMYQFDLYGPSAMSDALGPGFTQWLAAQPEVVPHFLKEQLARERQDPQLQATLEMEEHLHRLGRCTCSYARGMQQQLALLQYAAIATGSGAKRLPERLIGEAIREVVTHEVGHTLGLRHNFKASSWLTLEEIKRRRDHTDEPTTASVMDYNPLLFFAGDQVDKLRHLITPTLGPYDEWAIEYGYVVPKGKEEDALRDIAKRGTERALNYGTDEDTMWVMSPDPLTNRYDMGDEPVKYAEARIALADGLLTNILEWAMQPGEPRYYLTRAFNTLWSERTRNLQYVARMVSGQYFNRDHHDDPDARPAFVLVEPERQRAALKYLSETVFNDEFFKVDPALLNLLAPTRWGHWGSDAPARLDFPVHDNIRALQVSSLLTVSAPPVLQRLYDAELKSAAADKFTVAELIATLRDQIWRQLAHGGGGPYTDARPYLSSVARNLQRLHLDVLLNSVQARPGETVSADVQAMMRLAVSELRDKIVERMKDTKLDFASRAHLSECSSRIERVLNAQFQAR